MDKTNDWDSDMEVEIIDEIEELEMEYISTHGLHVNHAFKDKMKKLFDNQRKQITSMSQENRTMKKEQLDMEKRMLETLKELKREQCKADNLSSLQKELMQKSSLLLDKERQRKKLEKTVQHKDKLIANLEKESELNKSQLLEEKKVEKLSPETAQKIADFELEIHTLQQKITMMRQSEVETQRVAVEQQKLVSNYNAVIRKISRCCNKVITNGQTLSAADNTFNTTFCNESVQDQKIESSTFIPPTEKNKRKKSSIQIDDNTKNNGCIELPTSAGSTCQPHKMRVPDQNTVTSSSLANTKTFHPIPIVPLQNSCSLEKFRPRKSIASMACENSKKCTARKRSNADAERSDVTSPWANTRLKNYPGNSPKDGEKRFVIKLHYVDDSLIEKIEDLPGLKNALIEHNEIS